MPVNDRVIKEQARLQAISAKQQALFNSLTSARFNSTGQNPAQIQKLSREIDRVNGEYRTQLRVLGNVNQMMTKNMSVTSSFMTSVTRIGRTLDNVSLGLVATGTALGAVMTNAMSHYNPAAVIRLQQRMGDLQAVIGELLAPAFQDLTEDVHSVSNYLYNMSPAAKEVTTGLTKLAVPLVAGTAALGGLMLLARPVVGLTYSLYQLISATNSAALSLSGGKVGVGGGWGKSIGSAVGMGVGAYLGSEYGFGGTVAGTIAGNVAGGAIGKWGGRALGAGASALGGMLGGHGAWVGLRTGLSYGASAAGSLASPLALPAMIAGAGTWGIDKIMQAKGGMYGGVTKVNGSIFNAISDAGGIGQSLGYAFTDLKNIRTDHAGIIPDEMKAFKLAQSNQNYKETGFVRNAAGQKETDAAKIARLQELADMSRGAKNTSDFARMALDEKDSTGKDAARHAYTINSGTDIGRRVREAALTSAGSMGGTPDQQQVGFLKAIWELLSKNVPGAVANQRANADHQTKLGLS